MNRFLRMKTLQSSALSTPPRALVPRPKIRCVCLKAMVQFAEANRPRNSRQDRSVRPSTIAGEWLHR